MGFVMGFLLHVLTTGGVLWGLETYILPEQFAVVGDEIYRYGIVACIFGFCNTFVKPLLKVVMIPIQFFTLGLAGLLTNGILLYGIDWGLAFFEFPGVQLEVDNLLIYVIAGLVLGFVNTIIHIFR